MRTALCVVLSTVLLTACGERDEDEKRTHADRDEIQLFEKGKGVRLPAEMRQTLGVDTVEVTERAWLGGFERSARVYRAGRGTKPGAAMVTLGESEARELTPGQRLVLQVSTQNAAEIPGQIVRCQGQASSLGQAEALVEFPDAEGRLEVGSLLLAVFTTPETNTVFAVPESAVLRGVEGAFVYTVNGSYFTRTPVKLAGRRDGAAGIIDGLYAGDVVVAKGAEAMWMIELCALKGGAPCCPVPTKRSND